jgi:hypothetical protein
VAIAWIVQEQEGFMTENIAIDNYKLTLEATADGSGAQLFRAIATNIKDEKIVEALLNSNAIRSLLMYTYGGETDIVDVYIDRLAAQRVVELEATAKDPVILTADELIRFGFSPDDLVPIEAA